MIATTRTLRKIINILYAQKEPIGIRKFLAYNNDDNGTFKAKYKDGLTFLISIGVVNKIKTDKGVFYDLSYKYIVDSE